MQGYDTWLNSGNPMDAEPCFEEYIDSHCDGVCPQCNISLDVESDHTQCGEDRKDDIAYEAAADRYEDELHRYDYD